jgi:hypothetical protein
MRLLIDVGSCVIMLGGWLEYLFMYRGSSLGFLRRCKTRAVKRLWRPWSMCDAVPPAYFHFYSMSGSSFDLFLKLLRKKAQFELNSQWFVICVITIDKIFFRILNHGWLYRDCCSVDISLGSHSRGSIVFAKQLRHVCLLIRWKKDEDKVF